MTREERKNFLSQPINDISLRAYTDWKFPILGVLDNIHKQLLNDLDGNRYKTLEDINTAIERAKPAVDEFVKQKPEVLKHGTDHITKSLGFIDNGFLSKHPFASDSRETILKLRNLVKR